MNFNNVLGLRSPNTPLWQRGARGDFPSRLLSIGNVDKSPSIPPFSKGEVSVVGNLGEIGLVRSGSFLLGINSDAKHTVKTLFLFLLAVIRRVHRNFVGRFPLSGHLLA